MGACRFARGEGMWYGNDAIYFACTNGGPEYKGQIWRYVPSPAEGTPEESRQPGRLHLFVEPNDQGLIDNCDNLTVAPWGDLVVCEDGSGEQYLVGITPEGGIYRIAHNAHPSDCELAGVTFSPDGSTLFFNLQSAGLTLAVTGPWENRVA
jgi:secreted PhoX family phosphatase